LSPAGLRWLTARPLAHRGLYDLSQGRPENTLAAFRAAVASDYSIECDICLSSDSCPVVFHDDSLDRLTGETGPLSLRSERELCALPVCATAETIPSLDGLLACVAGRVPLVLELKSCPGREAACAAAVAARLAFYEGPVAVMSFDPALLAAMRREARGLPRGLVAEGGWRSAARHLRAILAQQLHFVSYSVADLPTPAPLLARHVLGLPLICWTVRDEEARRRADRWADQITFEGFLP
jgi:glycerophosphoryl diester phosphodiesterase